MSGVHWGYPLSILLYISEDKVIDIFIGADTRIKEGQIENYEMKVLNLPDATTLF